MPIYEFKCKKCGEVTEMLVGFFEKLSEPCPHCSGKLEKVYSVSGKSSGASDSDSGGSSCYSGG